MHEIACTLTALLLLAAALPSSGAELPVVRDGLALGALGPGTRSVIGPDPVQALIVAGTWAPPAAGEEVLGAGDRRARWRAVHANDKGEFDLGDGPVSYVYASVDSPEASTLLMEASGHGMAYVNAEPRIGDVYGYGYVSLPVRLRQGRNDLLFAGVRGSLSVRFVAPRAPVSLSVADATLPDFREGETGPQKGAVILVNATDAVASGLQLEADAGSGRVERSRLPDVPPMSVRKVPFSIPEPPGPKTPSPVRLSLVRSGKTLDARNIEVRRRGRLETFKRTFTSSVDGSLQYYAVNPARGAAREKRSLILSLHGASVEAIGQADAYGGSLWADIVCPTNRRPYGYDWEDWGRKDALEVLSLASRELKPDPSRVYLTGHSMGGHGTWHLGTLFPGSFGAIAPSAGWVSVKSYAQGARFNNPTPVESLLDRAANPSGTLGNTPNLASTGVYILHGDADDNVPVGEARAMVEALKPFHRDWDVHEQPGAGHWWDLSDEPGAECVDWPPLFDFLARHAIPAEDAVRRVAFRTSNPGVSATLRWATIVNQQRPLAWSSVDIRRDPLTGRFVGTTDNVRRLDLGVTGLPAGAKVRVELDGGALDAPWPRGGVVRLLREEAGWAVGAAVPPAEKSPARYGPLREGFGNRMVFVYGTGGKAAENAWAFAKARFDAEAWWYRGNGAVDVVPDSAFDAARDRDRGIVLYGNADTNSRFRELLGNGPVTVRRGSARVGDRDASGDLACLFVRPRPGSDVACVVAVAPTGPAGARLLDRLPYLAPMVALPDVLIVSPEALSIGAAGIRAAGFFGFDWSVERGDFAWQ